MNENEFKNEKNNQLENQIETERARLSTDRMDVSFGELINMYKTNELIIRPEYQRLFRWSNAQKTALIESILLGIPIPPIFVSEDKNGIWELIDGLQRISTIISFFGELKEDLTKMDELNEDDEEDKIISSNNWVLESGDLINNLEGFNIATLPKKYQINIKRSVCRVEILRGESNTEMKYELFKRLNSGGSKLTAQEIRNAIFRGINPKLNFLTEELSRNDIFKKYVVLSEQKKAELYDQELVLRFIAFLNNIESINSNTEKYLDDFMNKAVKDENFDLVLYKDKYLKVLNLLNDNCAEDIFRNEHNVFVPAYYEGITIGIAQNYPIYEKNPGILNQKIAELKNSEEFKKYSGTASNSKMRIKNRLKVANEIFANKEE